MIKMLTSWKSLPAVLVLSAIGLLSTSGAMAAADPERAAVLHTVQNVLDAWREADAAKLDAVLHRDFREVTLHFRDGKWEFAVEEREKLVATMARITKGMWDDRLIDPQVTLDGPIAVVWSHYRFTGHYVENGVTHTPVHCGVETFQLYRTDAGWKVVNFADTHADCK